MIKNSKCLTFIRNDGVKQQVTHSFSLFFVHQNSSYYEDDEEVEADNELQELLNELSAEGKEGDYAGLGMVG